MFRSRASGYCLLLAITLSLPILGQSPDLDAEWEQAASTVVPRLAKLADQARREKLYGTAVDLWEAVLVLDPDHPKARRFLRYSRKKKGEPWERKRKFKRPADAKGKDGIVILKERREITQASVDSILAVLDSKADRSRNERQAALARLIRLAPDHDGLRKAFGDVREGGTWIPEDALLAKHRRKELEAFAEKVKSTAPDGRRIGANSKEMSWGLPMNNGWRVDSVRALGTVNTTEVQALCRYTYILPKIFREVFDRKRQLPSPFSHYVFSTTKDKSIFLKQHPGLTEQQRSFYSKLGGAWVDNFATSANWNVNEVHRLDSGLRQATSMLLATEWQGSLKRGWIQEGLSMYLVHLVTGTRLTWYVKRSRYDRGKDGLRARLMKNDARWFKEGLDLLRGENVPNFRRVLELPLEDMEDEDLLASYIFAAWMSEAYRSKLVLMLDDLRNPHPQRSEVSTTAQALKTHMDMLPEEINGRLERWLEALGR